LNIAYFHFISAHLSFPLVELAFIHTIIFLLNSITFVIIDNESIRPFLLVISVVSAHFNGIPELLFKVALFILILI